VHHCQLLLEQSKAESDDFELASLAQGAYENVAPFPLQTECENAPLGNRGITSGGLA
jgi:hypothetical protein